MTTDRLQSGAHGAVDARGVGGAGGARDVTMAIVGADVLTLDPARPRASAVAVAADGTIAAVGDDAEIRARCGARTELVDGAGLTVTPGLVDGHVHPVWGAKLARGVELRDVHDVAGLRDALLAERARLGPQRWCAAGRSTTPSCTASRSRASCWRSWPAAPRSSPTSTSTRTSRRRPRSQPPA